MKKDGLWDSVRQLLGSSKSPSRDPLNSLDHKFHESPSGLAVPDSLTDYLRSRPALDARFGDIMSDKWEAWRAEMMEEKARRRVSASFYPSLLTAPVPAYTSSATCFACGQFYDPTAVHSCSAVLADALRARAMPVPLPVEQRAMPVIGFRVWKTDNAYKLGYGAQWRLKSTGVNAYWVPGINRAKCGSYEACHATPTHADHPVPSEHHDCGLYVLASVDEVEKHFTGIAEHHLVGAVLGWGKVVQHGTEGWRAQYARVIALMDMKFSPANDERAQGISEAYGVPILERPALERYVSEFGDPITEGNHGDAE